MPATLVGAAAGVRVGATTLEFIRNTNDASPVTVTIERTVVEYHCGVNVQRGSASVAAVTATFTAALSALTTARTSVFASNQSGAGQTSGSTAYTGGDVSDPPTVAIGPAGDGRLGVISPDGDP